MAAKKGYKAMNPADFKKIKDLQNYGLKTKQIAEITNRSTGTIYRVKPVETYEAYVAAVRQVRVDWEAKAQTVQRAPILVTPKLSIASIAAYKNTVYGLGQDSRVYTWVNGEWKLKA